MNEKYFETIRQHKGLLLANVSIQIVQIFHPFEVVDRGSETQLQVETTLNYTI